MGTPLLDAFGGALSVGKDILKFLIDAAQEGGFLNDVVVNLGAVLSDVFARIGTIVSAILAGELDFSALIPPEVMGVIQSFVGLLIRLSNWWTEYGPQIQATSARIFSEFQETARDLATQILPFVSEQLDKFGVWFTENGPLIAQYIAKMQERWIGVAAIISNFWGVVEPILGGLIDLVLNVVELVMQVFVGDWSAAWGTAGDILLIFRDTAIGFLGGLADWVASWFGTTWADIRTQWEANWEMFRIIITNAWENIQIAISGAIDNAGLTISQKLDDIRQSWQNVWDSIRIILATVWDSIKALIREQMESLFAAMGLDLDEMAAKWSAIWSDVLLIASTIWDKITLAIQERVNALRAWWEPKWNEFVQLITAAWNIIVAIVSSKIDELKLRVTSIIQSIRNWWETNWNIFTQVLETVWAAIVTVVSEKAQEVFDRPDPVDDNMLTLQGQGPDLEKKEWPDGEAPEWWEAEINATWGGVEAEARTAPHAICLAALKAVGIDVRKVVRYHVYHCLLSGHSRCRRRKCS